MAAWANANSSISFSGKSSSASSLWRVFSTADLSYCPVVAATLESKKYPSDRLKDSRNEGIEIRVMAKTIDNDIKRQLAKPQTWFCKYYPARIRNVGEAEIADRQLVYQFKDGIAFEEVAQRTAKNMIEQYGERCKDIVFSPVPASTSEKNELRYNAFCERVCELTGAANGFSHAKVCGGRLSIHENRKEEKQVRMVNIIEFDNDFYNGKTVIVFDDVITKGLSYAMFANQLETLGANVLGGIFLARTHYKIRR